MDKKISDILYETHITIFSLFKEEEDKSSLIQEINHLDLEYIFQSLESIFTYCESPLEQKFLLALLREYTKNCINTGKELFGGNITIWDNEIVDIKTFYPPNYEIENSNIFLFINPTIGKYRPDIVFSNLEGKKIIFELDSYQYHNTKNKLTEDKIRERNLHKDGYKIYRFSGTEIYKNPTKVAQEALEIIKQEYKNG